MGRLLQPCEATFRAGWAHARKRVPRAAARAGRRCRERAQPLVHCKFNLRRVTLFSEGIHPPEYSISALGLSNKPGPPHPRAITNQFLRRRLHA